MEQKILIVDDDKKLRILFGKRLSNAGYDVIYAENGEEGLRVAQEHRPAAIILDYQMPVMNGSKMLLALRDIDSICATPVILVTAASSTINIPGVNHADLVLQKPASTLELVTMVKRLIM